MATLYKVTGDSSYAVDEDLNQIIDMLTGATGDNAANVARSASTSASLQARVLADTYARFQALASGKLEWGPGNAALDVNLYRPSANLLQTDDDFEAANLWADTKVEAPTVNGTTVVTYASMRCHRHPYANDRHIESESVSKQIDDGQEETVSFTYTNAFASAPVVVPSYHVTGGTGNKANLERTGPLITANSGSGCTWYMMGWGLGGSTYLSGNAMYIAEGVD